MASRTSVTSENITVAPARTSKSAAKPTAGLAVTPENASLPPHCSPTTRSDGRARSRGAPVQHRQPRLGHRQDRGDHGAKAVEASSCSRVTMLNGLTAPSGGNSRAGCSFSQPRLTSMSSPPKFGCSARFCSVRIGTAARGASIATPQP